MQNTGTAMRIKARLVAVVDRLAKLIEKLPISHLDRFGGGLVFVAPEYYWGERSTEQRAAQLLLKRDYDSVSEQFELLLVGAPDDLVEQFKEANDGMRLWLELGSNWSISPDRGENERAMRSASFELGHILDVLNKTGAHDLILVPDTNSLLATSDPTEYREIAGCDSFVFMIIPTVIGELDRFKVEHKNPAVQEKAKKAISRIKGWRGQGSLTEGVTVDKTITVRAAYKEPDMKRTLSWLDSRVADDRILATILSLQADQPSARVVLVTGDTNLSNKAEAALVETSELPS